MDTVFPRPLDSSNHWKRDIWDWVSPRNTSNSPLLSFDILWLTHPDRTVLVYSGIFTFLVDAYPTYAASALAANSFLRSSFGAIFPLFGVQSMFDFASPLLKAVFPAPFPKRSLPPRNWQHGDVR
jgi:hypothetical protein